MNGYKTYKALLEKSVNSMLSAIEIYNKPNFSYREETFAILAINSWELLLKAELLKSNKYVTKVLYVMEPVVTKTGKLHKTNKTPRLNRSGNALTINFFETIRRLEGRDFGIALNQVRNIQTLTEFRDNAIHFHNEKIVSLEMQEIGFACIKNYIQFINRQNIPIDLSVYNFHLMPLAYIDSKVFLEGIITDEVKNYLDFLKAKISNQDKEDEDFDVAISIDFNFKKSDENSSLAFKYDPDGLSVAMSEENVRDRYPFTYADVLTKARSRYTNFVKNNKFNFLMSNIKLNGKLYHERRLDYDNPRSLSKGYYSSNIWQELDQNYSKNK